MFVKDSIELLIPIRDIKYYQVDIDWE